MKDKGSGHRQRKIKSLDENFSALCFSDKGRGRVSDYY